MSLYVSKDYNSICDRPFTVLIHHQNQTEVVLSDAKPVHHWVHLTS